MPKIRVRAPGRTLVILADEHRVSGRFCDPWMELALRVLGLA
jgi:hypothetical protein